LPRVFLMLLTCCTMHRSGSFCNKRQALLECGCTKLRIGSIQCNMLQHIIRDVQTLFTCGKVPTFKKIPWLESASELYRPSDQRLCAKLMPTSAHRGCRVVRVTDPYGCTRFSRPEQLLFLSSSSSIVLTRLRGPGSRPTTSQKIW
jgi:hypothetical protein